jgi:nucleotide-binding universal stress UspA family protein
MIHNILVGLDESIYSEAALELGTRWARQTGALLVGIGIVDEPTIRRPEPTGIGGSYFKLLRDEHRLEDARRRVRRFTERCTKRCTQEGVTCRVLEQVGLPSEQILAAAEDFDLTLLGQRTYFHFETQTDPDETLEVVLRNSRRPVVVAGEKLSESRSVVVAYDGSPPAVRALEAFQRAELDQWQAVRVVSVAHDPGEAARHAEEATRFLQFYDIPAEACSVPASGRVAEVLLEQVQEMNAGTLVMGAFGRSGVAETFFGSTTRTVLEKGDTLLFLHH